MLTGINPLLSGDLLRLLDQMGHGDLVVIADAHFPAYSMDAPVVELPVGSPEALKAVRTVVPVDLHEDAAVVFMQHTPGVGEDVRADLEEAADTTADRLGDLERFAFYDLAKKAFCVVRTGETRPYGNAILRKGLVEN